MRQVHVLIHYENRTPNIVAVLTNLERAQKFVSAQQCPDDMSIESYELDAIDIAGYPFGYNLTAEIVTDASLDT